MIFAACREEQFTVHRGVSMRPLSGASFLITSPTIPLIPSYLSTGPISNRPFVDSAPSGPPAMTVSERWPSRTPLPGYQTCTNCFMLYYFPSLWKTTKIIMIPKPQKPRIVPEIGLYLSRQSSRRCLILLSWILSPGRNNLVSAESSLQLVNLSG